ncbi:hypothetical protein HPHPP25_0266 [Helicobacter pylori Hp P-25]|nr:hypothetical protein HPHPP25_0266 [Helicobacter pylori Hp P-25]EJC35624.1 hypothetical protein HPHPP25C_0117 [Helicobacter pylori Hp P-25c]EJC38576.1 hypothetical protein HPHPP25D_0254 [Helicobacter pylori Hp P-25d]
MKSLGVSLCEAGLSLTFGAFSLGYKKDRLNNANFYLDCKKRL